MPQETLESFRKRPASHIVSLGSRCAVAHNLRRYYNFNTAYPFDWWITPLRGVIGYLERPDIDFLYSADELVLAEGSATVKHRSLYIELHHEFPRAGGQHSSPVVPDFLAWCEAPSARTRRLTERLLQLDDPETRILFVREQANATSCVEQLERALEATFLRATWCLAVVEQVPSAGRLRLERRPGPLERGVRRIRCRIRKGGPRPLQSRQAKHRRAPEELV